MKNKLTVTDSDGKKTKFKIKVAHRVSLTMECDLLVEYTERSAAMLALSLVTKTPLHTIAVSRKKGYSIVMHNRTVVSLTIVGDYLEVRLAGKKVAT